MSTPIGGRSTIRGAINGIGLLILLPLALLVGCRVFRFEYGARVVAAESAISYVLLPAYATLFAAAVLRLRILTIASAVVALCHIFWVSPELASATSLPKSVATAPHLRIYSHNVQFDNQRPDDLGADIAAANADVVMLQELSPRDLNAIRASGALAPYAFEYVKTDRGPLGMGMFSKLPLVDPQLVVNPGFPGIRAEVDLNGTIITLHDVHIQSPLYEDVKFWHEDLAKLKSDLAAETGPVIAAGDFNATWGHRPFRDLITNGWREASIDRGRGFARTWPMDRPSGVAANGFIRLDHVLTSRGVRPVDIHEGTNAGSDHRSVTADIAITGS